jgi:hypothetical protein
LLFYHLKILLTRQKEKKISVIAKKTIFVQIENL